MKKQVALVTGATDGIGKATAFLLARRGWHVIVVGRNAGRCDAVVAEIVGAGGTAEAGVADLGCMGDIRRLADGLLGRYQRLDALVLNANTITQDRQVTVDGFETNLAIGFLGRTLLNWALEPLLAATSNSQVLTVVGLDHTRLDLSNPHLVHGYSARQALMRWQWAVQVLARLSNQRGLTPINVFMPGLVKTKILASEPQPMRAFVQLMNLIIGIPVERSAEELVGVLDQVAAQHVRDAYFSRATLKPARDLGIRTGEDAALWAWTTATLRPWLGGV